MGIREAEIEDLDEITSLLLSVHLPVSGVADHLIEFFVLERGESIVGTIGMEVYGKQGLLRSMAVEPAIQRLGYGAQLVERLLKRATLLEIKEIVLLTETAQKFFERHGFHTIPRDGVNDDVKKSVEFTECCPESAVCMRRYL
jgi:amino-acid N-acetyltransferase